MEACLLALNENQYQHGQGACMREFFGRPMIEHVVELLARKKVSKIHVFVSDEPEVIERTLGDGTRWGVEFTYHYVKSEEQMFGYLPKLCHEILGSQDSVLLSRGSTLPCDIDDQDFSENFAIVNKHGQWTGWGNITQGAAAGPFAADELGSWNRVSLRVFSTESRSRQVKSHINALADKPDWLLIKARNVGNNIWVGAASSVSPKAEIYGPAFIGENTKIEAGAIIRANSFIGNNCNISETAEVYCSLVESGQFVSQNLTLERVVSGRKFLYSLDDHTSVEMNDVSLICEKTDFDFKAMVRSWLKRGLALALMACLSPLFVFYGLLGLRWRNVVVQSLDGDSVNWREVKVAEFDRSERLKTVSQFLHWSRLERFPQLWNVARGELDFFGLRPRTIMENEALPGVWRDGLKNAPYGVLQTISTPRSESLRLQMIKELCLANGIK